MKQIEPGDNGRNVEVWQRFLAGIWLLDRADTLPGHFDDATLAATKTYQVECGLEPTGVVDRYTIQQASLRGLEMIDNTVFALPSVGRILAGFSAFILAILVSQCIIMPNSGTVMQGVQLPISPSLVPGSPPERACPGWFC